ncbi:hypothetical protein [Phytohabitans kaempferiae]|uniref:Uncharacterized protein n=1 Tax=Phytohabitans kaempferiae TaxID=1620943 RepID=A0ABV6LXN3_9ACTN
MLLRTEHLHLAADHLDDAVRRLQPYGEAGVNYEVGFLDTYLPEIRAWLTDLAEDDDWADGFYNSYVEFALALALALPPSDPVAPWLPEDYATVDDGEVDVDTWRLLTEAAAGHSPVLASPRRT